MGARRGRNFGRRRYIAEVKYYVLLMESYIYNSAPK